MRGNLSNTSNQQQENSNGKSVMFDEKTIQASEKGQFEITERTSGRRSTIEKVDEYIESLHS